MKMQAFRAATLLKRDSNTSFFPVNIAKFVRALVLKNICERLLLCFHVDTNQSNWKLQKKRYSTAETLTFNKIESNFEMATTGYSVIRNISTTANHKCVVDVGPSH